MPLHVDTLIHLGRGDLKKKIIDLESRSTLHGKNNKNQNGRKMGKKTRRPAIIKRKEGRSLCQRRGVK